MPPVRKTKKDADAAKAPTKSRRGRKTKQEVEEEVLEEAEDEDLEEAEAPAARRRITEDIAARAAEMREEGATWQEVIDETGFNGAQLRPHIARLTSATIETLDDTPESVAEHREQGYAWYAMAISLDKTIAEIKEMAEEGGSDIEGRKYRASNGNGDASAEDEDEQDEDEQDEDEEDDEEEEAPAPKRRGRTAAKSSAKAKPAAKPVAKGRAKRPSKAA
jgi:hypothetical protein